MRTPAANEYFLSGEEENAGIAALCRGFLTTHDKKEASLPQDAHKLSAPA